LKAAAYYHCLPKYATLESFIQIRDAQDSARLQELEGCHYQAYSNIRRIIGKKSPDHRAKDSEDFEEIRQMINDNFERH